MPPASRALRYVGGAILAGVIYGTLNGSLLRGVIFAVLFGPLYAYVLERHVWRREREGDRTRT